MIGAIVSVIAVFSLIGVLWTLRLFKRKKCPDCTKSIATGYPNPPTTQPLQASSNVCTRNRTDLFNRPDRIQPPSLPAGVSTSVSTVPYYNEPPPPYSIVENSPNASSAMQTNVYNQLPAYDQLPGAMGGPISYPPYIPDPIYVLAQKR